MQNCRLVSCWEEYAYLIILLEEGKFLLGILQAVVQRNEKGL